jgi:peptidoglycan/xylan/chitin deacetylase (PgdA/CDA1 family)
MIYLVFILLVLFLGWFLYIPVPWMAGKVIRNCQKARARRMRTVFLTFDDGPGTRLTPRVLTLLRERGIRATFFILGRNIQGREEILKSIVKEGHMIACHGYSHDHAWKVMPWRSLADIKKGYIALHAILAGKPKSYVYRPPCGKLNLLTLLYLWKSRIPIIYWTADCLDTWSKDRRNSMHAAETIRTDGGGVVLFHDFDRATEETDEYVLHSVKAVLETGQKAGLAFATIDQLIEKEERQ